MEINNMKIFYCKTCMAKNKNRLTDAKSYESSLLYEPNVSYKSINDYKGILFEDKALSAECPICKTKMLDSNIDNLKEFYRITEFGNYSADFLLAMIDLKKNDIIKYTNQMNIINAKAEDESQKRYNEYLAQQRAEEEDKNTRHCPKCGCANFTPVRKKYGLFMGFATNKVELVCNNCGYRMKAEN